LLVHVRKFPPKLCQPGFAQRQFNGCWSCCSLPLGHLPLKGPLAVEEAPPERAQRLRGGVIVAVELRGHGTPLLSRQVSPGHGLKLPLDALAQATWQVNQVGIEPAGKGLRE